MAVSALRQARRVVTLFAVILLAIVALATFMEAVDEWIPSGALRAVHYHPLGILPTHGGRRPGYGPDIPESFPGGHAFAPDASGVGKERRGGGGGGDDHNVDQSGGSRQRERPRLQYQVIDLDAADARALEILGPVPTFGLGAGDFRAEGGGGVCGGAPPDLLPFNPQYESRALMSRRALIRMQRRERREGPKAPPLSPPGGVGDSVGDVEAEAEATADAKDAKAEVMAGATEAEATVKNEEDESDIMHGEEDVSEIDDIKNVEGETEMEVGEAESEAEAEQDQGTRHRRWHHHRLSQLRRRLLRAAPVYERYTVQRTGGRGCGSRKTEEIENENFGRDPHVTPAPRPDEKPLIECLRQGPAKCGASARVAARRLPSVLMMPPVGVPRTRRAHLGSFDVSKPPPGNGSNINHRQQGLNHAHAAKSGLLPQASNGTNMFPAIGGSGSGRGSGSTSSSTPTTRFKSCAVVGNAGHITDHEWGTYVDAHDVVARFNRQAVSGFTIHVGRKTTHRFINHNDGLAVCCRGVLAEKRGLGGGGGGGPPGGPPGGPAGDNKEVDEDGGSKRQRRERRQHPRIILWHLAAREKLLSACQSRYPQSTTLALDFAYIKASVAMMREMRKDLLRLGFGPFNFWRQMTGGAHGIFAMLPVCDTVSLYGFTSWVGSDVYSKTQRDQYAGKAQKSKAAATIWHDWEAEQMMWRLLHAAGRVNVCSL